MDMNMVNEGTVDEIITKFHWKYICKQNRKLKGGNSVPRAPVDAEYTELNISEL